MIIKKLIEKLQECDQDLEVLVNLTLGCGSVYEGDVMDVMQLKVTRKDGFTTSWVEIMCEE